MRLYDIPAARPEATPPLTAAAAIGYHHEVVLDGQ
jgi:hypothetical protein